MLPSARWALNTSLKVSRPGRTTSTNPKAKAHTASISNLHRPHFTTTVDTDIKAQTQSTDTRSSSTRKPEKIIKMVQEQAKVLAKKNRSLRASAEMTSRVDREGNAVVAANVRKLVKEGDAKLVEELLRSSSALSQVPFVAALRSMIRAKETEAMHDLFRLMRSKSILPPAAVFGEVVAHLAKEAYSSSSKSKSTSSYSSSSTSSSESKYGAAESSVNGQRALFFFNDLKTAFVPPAFCYEAIWRLLKTNSKHPDLLTPAHESLWKEMMTSKVQPTESLFLALLRSIRAQHSQNMKKTSLDTQLSEFEVFCRSSFGFNHVLTPGKLRLSKISGKIVKSWLATVMLTQGEERAFELAASLFVTAEGALPTRQATLHLESMATLKADLPGSSPSSLHSSVHVIPTEFSPFEPLIELLAKKDPLHPLIVAAWNRMPRSAQLAAAPTTFAAVAAAVDPSDLGNLYHTAPQGTRVAPFFAETFQSLAQRAGDSNLTSEISSDKL